MIYVCDKCHFIFKRTGEPDACPVCGKSAIREADEYEREEYQKIAADGCTPPELL